MVLLTMRFPRADKDKLIFCKIFSLVKMAQQHVTINIRLWWRTGLYRSNDNGSENVKPRSSRNAKYHINWIIAI